MYARLIIVSFLGIFSSRFILQSLGASDFGLYNVVGGIVFMMAFLNNIMVSTTYRYIAFELGTGDLKCVNKVFNISMIIHIFIAIFIVFFAETIGIYYIRHYLNVVSGKLNDALFVFHLSIFSILLSVISVPFQGLIIAKEKFSVAAVIEITRSFFALGVVIIIFFYAGNRLRMYAILISLVSILPSLLYFYYSRNSFPLLISWNFQKDYTKYKEMIGFSGWIMFGAAASASEIQGSALMLNQFFGTILNASFGIANQVNNMVKMFAQSLNQAVIPQITKSHSGGNADRTLELVIFSSKYSFFLMLFPAVPILLEIDYILLFWLKHVPEYTSIFIRLQIFNSLISTMSAGIPAAIHATGRIKYFQIILGGLTLTGLPISYFLLRYGSPPYIILVVYSIITLLALVFSQILLKKLLLFNTRKFISEVYIKIIWVSVFISPLFLITKLFESNLIRFVGITSLSVLWILLAVFLLGTERHEKQIIGDYIRKWTDHYITPHNPF